MLKTLARVGIATLVALSLGLSAVPARADNSAASATMVSGAHTAIKNAMDAAQQAQQKKQQESLQSKLAQVPPVSQQPVGGKAQVGLPTGFTARAHDASADEKPRLWKQMVAIWPDYDAYQAKTERVINWQLATPQAVSTLAVSF